MNRIQCSWITFRSASEYKASLHCGLFKARKNAWPFCSSDDFYYVYVHTNRMFYTLLFLVTNQQTLIFHALSVNHVQLLVISCYLKSNQTKLDIFKLYWTLYFLALILAKTGETVFV